MKMGLPENKFSLKRVLRHRINAVVAVAVIAVVLIILVLIKGDGTFFSEALSTMCVNLRGVVTIFCYICLLFLLFLICSKYGNIRLGGENATKEYSTFSWLSCLFMAGCGIGIVFYCQEPILHMHSNPYSGNVPGSSSAVAYSLTLFNWTINAWGQYGVLGVIISYFYFNRRMSLKLSSVLPAKVPSWAKRVVDILMALGIIAGLTTSLGLGVSQIESGFSYVFNQDISPYILMILISIVAAWSVTSGLKRGVKWLSNLSFVLVGILLVFVVLVATFRLDVSGFLKYIADGTWLLFRNFLSYNDFYNHASDQWAASYPIFFDLWFAAWAAFVAVFVAKISRGRTIREFIIGVVGIPTLFTIIWFGIFGRVGLEFKNLLYDTMSSDITTSLFIFLRQLAPNSGYVFLSTLVLLIICMFFITSSDSGSFVVATLLSDKAEVEAKERMFWAVIQCLVAMTLFACGGLALVQSVSVIMGIIVMGLILLGCFFFIRTLLKDTASKRNIQ